MNGTTHYVSPAMASWRGAEEADGHGSIASSGDGPRSVALAAGIAVAVVIVGAGALCARRRWLG